MDADFRTDPAGADLVVWLWDTALLLAARFGVFEPQMVRHPHGSDRMRWRLGPL